VDVTCTSNGVKYEEFTLIELISNPFKKVMAVFPGIFWLMYGRKAIIVFPE
jgi:hypothetical protein